MPLSFLLYSIDPSTVHVKNYFTDVYYANKNWIKEPSQTSYLRRSMLGRMMLGRERDRHRVW